MSTGKDKDKVEYKDKDKGMMVELIVLSTAGDLADQDEDGQ